MCDTYPAVQNVTKCNDQTLDYLDSYDIFSILCSQLFDFLIASFCC